jgi:hypothetical protein
MLGARAVVVDEDREWERVRRQPTGDVFALLAQHDDDVEAVGLKLAETVAQLRDAEYAVGSPGGAVELDQDGALARGGEVEGGAGGGDAREGGGWVAWDHGAAFTAIVRPSRKGTSVVAKSGDA